MGIAITAGPTPTASFASSSIPSTSPASRLTKENTSSRPRNPICPRSMPCVLYKQLSEVERAFANLKDVLDLRPIYHRTDDRVQAHIFVAALAFLLHRAIEKKLKTARLDLSATEALTALKSVRVVDIDLGDGTTKRSVTRPTQRAAAVLRALAIP